MNLSLITKLALAGVVLTGITGTAAIGNISGVNQVVKAEVENPNQHLFKKVVDGQELDFSDIFNRDSVTSKELADDIVKKLNEKGLNPVDYKMKLEVKDSKGGIVKGGGPVVNVDDNQSQPFNPTKDKIEVFEITK